MGTQQVEDLVKKRFPQARVLRMDLDTTKNKDGHEKILSAFANEEADILIGTQMIVKGHDFPGVTLVGILAADMSLYGDDYRSGERTFQLLVQAAGRAGRGNLPGEVEHYSIVNAAKQDYESFYEEEISYRRLMGYPPAAGLMAIYASGADEALLTKASGYLKDFAVRAAGEAPMAVIGPASPGIGKINDIYRKVIYLMAVKDRMEKYIEINRGFQSLKIQFDMNP